MGGRQSHGEGQSERGRERQREMLLSTCVGAFAACARLLAAIAAGVVVCKGGKRGVL